MLLALFLSLVACAPASADEDPAALACAHAAEAGTTVVAGADAASAAAITIGEEPYTVTLVDGAPGFVAVEVGEDTPALLFLGTADVAASLWHGDEEVGLPSPAPNDLCPDDIPEHHDLDLHPGTWTIELGPAAVADVWLLLSPADGHGHE